MGTRRKIREVGDGEEEQEKEEDDPVNTKHLYNIYTMLDLRWSDVV